MPVPLAPYYRDPEAARVREVRVSTDVVTVVQGPLEEARPGRPDDSVETAGRATSELLPQQMLEDDCELVHGVICD